MYLDSSRTSINYLENPHLTSRGRIRDPNSDLRLGSQVAHMAVVMNVFTAILPAVYIMEV
jgi:hypothetical protein